MVVRICKVVVRIVPRVGVSDFSRSFPDTVVVRIFKVVVRIVFRVAIVVVRVFKVLVRIVMLVRAFRILVKIFRVFTITVRITVRFAGRDGLQDCLRGFGRIFKILSPD